MSEGTVTFRKTLEDIDRIRKWQIVAFLVLFCIVVGRLLWLGHLGRHSHHWFATDALLRRGLVGNPVMPVF